MREYEYRWTSSDRVVCDYKETTMDEGAPDKLSGVTPLLVYIKHDTIRLHHPS